MPWSPSDATDKTKKADTPKKQRQWQHIANGALARGEDEATAIKMANGVLKKEDGLKLAKGTGG